MTNKKVKWIKPDHKYTTPMEIEIDQDFIDTEIKEQAIKHHIFNIMNIITPIRERNIV